MLLASRVNIFGPLDKKSSFSLFGVGGRHRYFFGFLATRIFKNYLFKFGLMFALAEVGDACQLGCRGCPQHLLHLQECPSMCHHHQAQNRASNSIIGPKHIFVFGKANKKLHCNRCNHCNLCEALKQVALYQRQVAPGDTTWHHAVPATGPRVPRYNGSAGCRLQNTKEGSENRECLSENRILAREI